MAQERFHDFQRPLVSLDENYRLVGLVQPGLYAGFDNFAIVAGNLVKLVHTDTGAKRLKSDGTGDVGPFGVYTTRQGVVVYDDTEVQVAIDYIVTNPRIDVLVANHTHLDSPGGAPVTYSIIKGAEAVVPATPPISNPLTQIKLGHFIVIGTANHSGLIFIPADRKTVGGKYAFSKATEEDLNRTVEKDFNKVQRTGLYFMDSTTANRPNTSTAHWALQVLRYGTRIAQIAINADNGRMYYRAATATVNNTATTWTAWGNLANAEVPGVDLSGVLASIGTQLYTENNYVVDGQSLTSSIDSLDMVLKDLDTFVTSIDSALDTVIANIGTLLYSQNNFITDGESITASLEKLDIALQARTGGVNRKVVTSSTWDMDASLFSPNVPHGVGAANKIVGIQAFVDIGAFQYPLQRMNSTTFAIGGSVFAMDNTNITFARATGGEFDTALFSTAVLRVLIDYLP